MPIVQLDPTPLDATRTRPEGAVVTPGQDDVIYGSDAPEAPGWADTFGAGWRQDNTIVSQLSRKDMSLPTYKEEGFDPWAKIKGTPLEEHWPSFADIHNQRAFDMRQAQIEQEQKDKRTLASAPWYKAMPAAISAGTLDWPSLLPGGAMIRGVKGGFSLAKTAATTGALAGVSSAAQEAALHATQQTRTPDESLSGIGSSVVLGALLGAGGAKLLNHFEWKAALDAHDRFVAGEPPPVVRPMEGITREETAKAAEGAKLAEAPSGETISEGVAQEPRPAGVVEQSAIPSVGELAKPPSQIAEEAAAPFLKGRGFDKWLKEANYTTGLGEVADALGINSRNGRYKGDVIEEIKKAIGYKEPEKVRHYIETRGSGERFHGTGSPIGRLSDDFAREPGHDNNFYGNGFYTTDAADMAAGYTKKGGKEPTLYKVEEKPVKLFNMEEPLTPEIIAIAKRNMGEHFPTETLSGKPVSNLRELFDEYRDDSSYNSLPKYEVQETFDGIRGDLEKLGYRGYEHIGGLRTKNDPHNVRIYWFPEQDVKISKADIGAYRELAARTDSGLKPRTPVKEPQALLGFVRSLGGVKDWKGELKAADINKRFPGLIAKNGADLDKAREAAEEAGYLPAGATPDDLVRALLSDEPVYSVRDKDQALAFHAQERAKEYEATVAQNRKEIRDAFGEGAGPDDLVDRAAHIMAQENVDHEMAVAMAAEQDGKLPEFMNENNPFVDFDEDEWTNFRGSPASVGAAAAVPAGLEDNAIAGRAAAWLANASRFPVKGGSVHWNPLLRAIHSISPKVRELLLSMAENPLYLNKNMEGVATAPAAETLMKEWQGGLADATRANRSAFRDFRKNGGRLSHQEFNEAVADAMRNNDHSPIPQVQSAAQSWRAKVVEPLKNAAIKANLLPEDVSVETAASYFTRWWNRNKLIAQEPKFKHIVRSWVESSMPRWQAEFDKETTEAATTMSGKKLKDYLAKREAEYEERFGLYPGEVSSGIADDVFNTLTGRVEGGELRPELIKVQARGPLKERTFSIPDKLIAEFLENDVERVMDRYVRTMGADVEIANKFGHLDFSKLEQEINADYARLSEQAKTEAQRTALEVSRQNDIADIKGIWDLLRGTGSRFAHPWEQNFDHISRMVRLFNYIRLMGEASLASLSETVRPAMVHGLMPYMQTIGQLATNLQGIRLSVNEAKLAGQIAEGVLGHRMALMTEISDPYSSVTKSEAVLRSMSDIASKWNGIRLLTDAQKSIASVMTQNRLLEGVGKYASLPAKEKAYLAYLGIDARMAERINAQFRAPGAGRIVNGVRVAGTEKWTDEMAKRIYRAAINKDVDSIITTPGVADVPLFVNTPVGAAMVQFRRFALAAHQRVLLRGLQEDHTRFLGGMIAMAALGMFTTWLKAVSANREEKLSDFSKKPGWWVGEGLDKSGVLAGAMEVANAFEKATGYNPIKTPMQMMDEGEKRGSQKNQNRNDIGMIFGPSVGTAEDIMTAAKIPLAKYNEMRGKPGARVTKAQKNAAERLLPFNSYPIARQFLRYVINPQ